MVRERPLPVAPKKNKNPPTEWTYSNPCPAFPVPSRPRGSSHQHLSQLVPWVPFSQHHLQSQSYAKAGG